MGETMVKYGEKMSDEDLEHLYIEADKNGDGRVDFSDFIQMMMSKWKQCFQLDKCINILISYFFEN